MNTPESGRTAGNPKHFLRFRSGDVERLVDAAEIVEVVPMVALRAGDGDIAHEKYAGLLDYRGHVVPVFDLAGRSGACQRSDSFLVVLGNEDEKTAVVATEVDEVVQLDNDCLSTLKVATARSILVGKVGQDMVRVLTVAELYE